MIKLKKVLFPLFLLIVSQTLSALSFDTDLRMFITETKAKSLKEVGTLKMLINCQRQFNCSFNSIASMDSYEQLKIDNSIKILIKGKDEKIIEVLRKYNPASFTSSFHPGLYEAMPYLVQLLKHKNETIRSYSILAMSRFAKNSKIVPKKIMELTQDKSEQLRQNAYLALTFTKIDLKPYSKILITALQNERDKLKLLILESIANSKNDRFNSILFKLSKSKNRELQYAVLEALINKQKNKNDKETFLKIFNHFLYDKKLKFQLLAIKGIHHIHGPIESQKIIINKLRKNLSQKNSYKKQLPLVQLLNELKLKSYKLKIFLRDNMTKDLQSKDDEYRYELAQSFANNHLYTELVPLLMLGIAEGNSNAFNLMKFMAIPYPDLIPLYFHFYTKGKKEAGDDADLDLEEIKLLSSFGKNSQKQLLQCIKDDFTTLQVSCILALAGINDLEDSTISAIKPYLHNSNEKIEFAAIYFFLKQNKKDVVIPILKNLLKAFKKNQPYYTNEAKFQFLLLFLDFSKELEIFLPDLFYFLNPNENYSYYAAHIISFYPEKSLKYIKKYFNESKNNDYDMGVQVLLNRTDSQVKFLTELLSYKSKDIQLSSLYGLSKMAFIYQNDFKKYGTKIKLRKMYKEFPALRKKIIKIFANLQFTTRSKAKLN